MKELGHDRVLDQAVARQLLLRRLFVKPVIPPAECYQCSQARTQGGNYTNTPQKDLFNPIRVDLGTGFGALRHFLSLPFEPRLQCSNSRI